MAHQGEEVRFRLAATDTRDVAECHIIDETGTTTQTRTGKVHACVVTVMAFLTNEKCGMSAFGAASGNTVNSHAFISLSW